MLARRAQSYRILSAACHCFNPNLLACTILEDRSPWLTSTMKALNCRSSHHGRESYHLSYDGELWNAPHPPAPSAKGHLGSERYFSYSTLCKEESSGLDGRLKDDAGGNSIEDVQTALEHAMIEAYRLLEDDKVEQAEFLISEGLTAAESVLDARDPGLAQIWDQAALLQFFLGRFKEAERNCLKSLEAAQALAQEDSQASAMAMCTVRLATIRLGLDRREEGTRLLQGARKDLLDIYGSELELMHEIEFYSALTSLPPEMSVGDLEAREKALLQALKGMSNTPTVGIHLLRAAFREHRALMDTAVSKRDWNLAESILLQAIKLQEEVCPASDELALTTYQYGTLEYVRGDHVKAMGICGDSLALALALYKKESHSQVALREHRIGTIRLALGDYRAAADLLERSSKRLVRTAGEANPLTGESRCALALAKLAQLRQEESTADAYTRILLPKQQSDLLAEAEIGLTYMQRGFGSSHMLTMKLNSLYADIVHH